MSHAFTVGSLFSGIGGLDLGFEWAGFKIAWQCEADSFCRAVLRKHWPTVECYDDVRTLRVADAHGRRCDGKQDVEGASAAGRGRTPEDGGVEPVDVLIGGFPCQDVSDAGKRAGLVAGARSGLWREFARLIGELRPRAVCVENVAGLFARGLDVVLGDLAALGYDAEWQTLRAADVGAPHRRERVFIVAYAATRRWGKSDDMDRSPRGEQPDPDRRGETLADTGRTRLSRGGLREREEAAEEMGNAWASDCGVYVADASGDGRDRRGKSEPTGVEGARKPIVDGRGDGRTSSAAAVADAARRGQREQWGAGEPGHGGYLDGGDTRLDDTTVTRLEGYQPSARDEGHVYRWAAGPIGWPARPGEPQHEWEPPRVLRRAQSGVGVVPNGLPRGLVRHRRRALAALGNAVVPQVAEVVAWRVRAILEAQH